MKRLAALLFCSVVQAAMAEVPPADSTLVLHTHTGTYSCTNTVTGHSCGADSWTMTVLQDGHRILQSRTLRPADGGSLLTLTLMVDRDFNPVDGFENVFSSGQWLGAGHFSVTEGMLRMSINGPDEYFTLEREMPAAFSLLLHPAAADGWHFAFYDLDKAGVQLHPVCSLGRLRRGVACDINLLALEYLGRARITVPAGSFDTEHYRFGEGTEVWLTGPDRVVVKHVFGAAQASTELVSYRRTSGEQARISE